MARPLKRQRATPRRTARLRVSTLGCGVDIVELDRFQEATRRGGRRFLERVFTAGERRQARGHRAGAARLAARFAAKEAVVKAVAQLHPERPLTLGQIEICNDELGRPHVILHGWRGNQPAIEVSLSHAEHVAVACAIASSRRGRR